jgi:ubiquitin-protein ligase
MFMPRRAEEWQMRESPRIRRLRTDRRALDRLRSESTIVDFVCHGDPPESYLIRFYGKGLYRPDGSPDIVVGEQHEVGIRLGASYPRMMPELSWKTPIFHPNISGSGIVCLGGYGTYWVPSLNLDELCCMLWDMIRYQNFDVESPYNREAAQWTRTQGSFRLPLDHRPLRDKLANAPRVKPQPVVPATEGTDAVPVAAIAQPAEPEEEVIFLGDTVEAQVVEPDDPDILFIE